MDRHITTVELRDIAREICTSREVEKHPCWRAADRIEALESDLAGARLVIGTERSRADRLSEKVERLETEVDHLTEVERLYREAATRAAEEE